MQRRTSWANSLRERQSAKATTTTTSRDPCKSEIFVLILFFIFENDKLCYFGENKNCKIQAMRYVRQSTFVRAILKGNKFFCAKNMFDLLYLIINVPIGEPPIVRTRSKRERRVRIFSIRVDDSFRLLIGTRSDWWMQALHCRRSSHVVARASHRNYPSRCVVCLICFRNVFHFCSTNVDDEGAELQMLLKVC